MGVGSNPTSDKIFFVKFRHISAILRLVAVCWQSSVEDSRVAQWKRAGPITQRSVDRNHALLSIFHIFASALRAGPLV